MTVLVDSDILIEIARGRDGAIVSRWMELSESSEPILCTPVSVAELWGGVRIGEETLLAGLFGNLALVPIDFEIGKMAGIYMSRYRKSHAVELGDAIIAAAASLNSAILWTRNRKHYPMPELSFY